MDVAVLAQINKLKSSINTVSLTLNDIVTLLNSGKLKYLEVSQNIDLSTGAIVDFDLVLPCNFVLITSIFVSSSNGTIYTLEMFNKQARQDVVYRLRRITNYSDSITMSYNDNDNNEKLYLKLTNNDVTDTVVTIKIIGIQMEG